MNMRRFAGFFLVLILAGSLVGCISFDDLMSGSLLGKTEARMNQAMADAVGLGALEDSMIATIMYAQVFYAGGYGAGYEDFSEGEGVAWNITSRNDESESSVQVERALLKRNSDGTAWWFLRYKAENEEEFISEALVDDEYTLLKFRYYDAETDSVREWIPEQEESVESTEVEEETAEEVGFYDGDFKNFSTGKVSVTVPAGSYSAEHFLIEDTYVPETEGEEGYEVRYEWWLADKVPGDIVKYSWENLTDDTAITGELTSNKTGYKTRLDSF